MAWPKQEPWQPDLDRMGASFDELGTIVAQLCNTIARSERVRVLVDAADKQRAAACLGESPVELVELSYADVWLRDTAPVFIVRDGELAAVRARFNGWGGSYLFEEDLLVSPAISGELGVDVFELPIVFEGGGLEVDGAGRAMTTRQCLLNPNRNPGAREADIERALADAFDIDTLTWLDEGLINDHTDGHIDTLARFVAPNVVAFMEPAPGDPNRDALLAIRKGLRGFDLVAVPSPGAITDRDGVLLPASYLNFYIANGAVVVPVYGSPHDDAAVAAIAAAFPGRDTVAIDARLVVAGGGAFHCITQEQPRVR